MSARFVSTSSHHLLNSASPLPSTGYPFTVAMWCYPTVVDATTKVFWCLNDTGAAATNISLQKDGSDFPAISAAAGGAANVITISTVMTVNRWHFIIGRAIASNNRRISCLYPSGSVLHGSGTTNRAPTSLDTITIGANNSAGTPGTFWDGFLAEYTLFNADIGHSTAADLNADFVRQLAFKGPFSIPTLVGSIVEYRRFRSHIVSAEDRFGEIYWNNRYGRQTYTNPNGAVTADHPPLVRSLQAPYIWQGASLIDEPFFPALLGGGPQTFNQIISIGKASVVAMQRAMSAIKPIAQPKALTLLRATTEKVSIAQPKAVATIRLATKPKGISVPQGKALTLLRAAGKLNPVAQPKVLSLRVSISHFVNIAQAKVANLVRTITESMRITQAKVAALVRLKSAPRSLSITQAKVVATVRRKQAVKTLSIAQAKVAVLARSVAKRIQVTKAKVLNLIRQTGRRISIAQAKVVAVTRIKTLMRSISVAQSKIAALRRSMVKRVSVAQAKVASVATAFIGGGFDTFNQVISIAQGKTVAMRRQTAHFVMIAQAKALNLRAAINRRVSIAQAKAVQALRAASRRISIAQAKTLTTVRARATVKALNVAQAKVVAVRRSISRQVQVAQAKVANLYRVLPARIDIEQMKAVSVFRDKLGQGFKTLFVQQGKAVSVSTGKIHALTIGVVASKVAGLVRALLGLILPPPDTRNMAQVATYWPPLGNTGFGNATFEPPILILCRWQAGNVLYRTAPAQEAQASDIVYSDRTLEAGGYLALGDHSATLDPIDVATAREIRQTGISPAPLIDRQLNKNWL